ncbi:MAG TPA: carbon-nitrogen hydrolase family protein [Phycisphaerales bacterium]|nr:carbon-nitrogen hydrolase family protein [Phycisphaerales bacterium]
MASPGLNVAACQFAVGKSISQNARDIRKYIREAKNNAADIVHFPECALSGYAGTDFESFEGFDWDLLKKEMESIMTLAGQLRIWVVLGSSHRLSAGNKPHNSLYLINPDGQIADRYDKRFCTERDLGHFTPGSRFVHFEINEIRCTLLICFDLRFPEIYRALQKAGVDCIFQSFYNARQKGKSIHKHIMRQTMQCRAATNYFWISMVNASGVYCPYGSCLIRPDGKIVGNLRINRCDIMVNNVNLDEDHYDPSESFREMAMNGALSNGPKIDDPRSKDTTCI